MKYVSSSTERKASLAVASALCIALILASLVTPVLAKPVAPKLTAEVRGSQITVFVNTEVTVWVKVKTGGYAAEGTLKVEVKKDIVWGSDQVHKTLTVDISVPANTVSDWINVGTFIPTDLTGDLPGQVRQYFIKVYFEDTCIYDPTDPNTREWVKTKSGEVAYYMGEFEGIG